MLARELGAGKASALLPLLSCLRRKCPADTIALPELGLAYSPDGTGLTLKTRRCSRFASKRGSVFVLASLSLSMMA
jgi:hypothetical protein